MLVVILEAGTVRNCKRAQTGGLRKAGVATSTGETNNLHCFTAGATALYHKPFADPSGGHPA